MNVKHIARVFHGRKDRATAYCGQKLWSHDWFFQSVDHAMNSWDSSSPVPCLRCLKNAQTRLTRVIRERQE